LTKIKWKETFKASEHFFLADTCREQLNLNVLAWPVQSGHDLQTTDGNDTRLASDKIKKPHGSSQYTGLDPCGTKKPAPYPKGKDTGCAEKCGFFAVS
jgi:hypothetical protein